MQKQVIQTILQEKIIVIVRGVEREKLLPLCESLYKGGIRLLEITYSAKGTPSDEETAENIRYLAENFQGRMCIGAGTVLTEKQVELTAKAGGKFIISPDAYPSVIQKTKDFEKPSLRLKNGAYKMKSGMVYTCFSTDFLIEEADSWRGECWQMIKEREDCTFLFLTKRIHRFMDCIPEDWGDGYDNVVICCTIENQKNADYKLGIFSKLPIKHKCITAQPLIEAIDIEGYLDGIELVVVGGESDVSARPLDYAWVLAVREQCIRQNVSFEFRQCGTHFIKDGKEYRLQTKDLCAQARKAGIDFKANSSPAFDRTKS